MTLSYAYISISIISLILILAAFVITLRKSTTRENKALTLVVFFIFIGSFFTLLEMMNSTYEGKLLFRNLSQLGLFLLPASSYNFIMLYTHVENRILFKLRKINFIFAIICVLLIFTNDYHHIMRSDVILVSTEHGLNLSVVQTLFGKIAVSLNTLMNVIAIINLWIYKRTTSKSTRMQINLVLAGFLIPFLFTYTKTMLRNVSGFEIPSSFSFLIGVTFILVGIYKYDFMSISPVARDWVIDEIDIGMIFTNPDGDIVDINAFAKRIFSEDTSKIKQMILETKDWKKAILDRENTSFEIIHDDSGKKTYNIKVHDLSKKQKSIGSVSLITDITLDKMHKDWLEIKAQRDSLTKILNRENFEIKVNQIIESVSTTNRKGALLILDIDRFKYINDNYGHQIGDRILVEVVNILSATIREKDLLGRLGGDEFAIFTVDTRKEDINQLIYRIQERLKEHVFADGKIDTKVTLSIGAHIQGLVKCSFEEFYGKADQAMYKSKDLGRNRATTFI